MCKVCTFVCVWLENMISPEDRGTKETFANIDGSFIQTYLLKVLTGTWMQQKIILSGAQVRQFSAKEETFPALTLGLSCLTSPGKLWTTSQMEEVLILFKRVKGMIQCIAMIPLSESAWDWS